MQRFSIRSLLVLLVLAVALPLSGLLVYITHLRVEARATFVREPVRGAGPARVAPQWYSTPASVFPGAAM